MSLNVSASQVGRTNVTAKAEGFNQGMQLAANRFDTFIYALVLVYALKVVLKLPPIQNRLDGYVEDTVEVVDFGADVLGFFIVVVLFYAVSGKNILGV